GGPAGHGHPRRHSLSRPVGPDRPDDGRRRQGGDHLARTGHVLAECHDPARTSRGRRCRAATPRELCDDARGAGALSDRILIPRALTPAAFAARVVGGAVERFGGETMGTNWSLQAVAPPTDVACGVEAAFGRVIAQMSQWEPESDLSRINRAPAGEWRAVS